MASTHSVPATIVFDFDGTLHDSMHIYRKALQEGYDWLVSIGEAPKRRLTNEDMEANIGLTARDAWERMCPGTSWRVSSMAAERVGTSMHSMIEDGTARLFEGVPQMLDELRGSGHELVLLSNCSAAYLAASRKAFGLDRWFCRYYCAEDYNWIAKEQIFETLRHQVQGPYIVVGDRSKDLAVGAVHGLPCIACAYGYGTPEELAGAEQTAHSPADICKCVERIEHGGRIGTGGRMPWQSV